MKILVTGASGFVGKELTAELDRRGISYGIYNRETDEPKSFKDFSAIVHLAAKVHDMNYPKLESFIPGNVELTEKLINRAVKDCVPHFLFLSSIKVNGEERDEPYFEVEVPAPKDSYGLSKWMAENIIKDFCKKINSTTCYTIIRPPLIYGAGVKGNLRALMKLAKLPVPLPLGGIRNKRSYIALSNLVDLIIYCLVHPEESSNKTILANDGSDYSTSELLKILSGFRIRLFTVPTSFYKLFLKLLGRETHFNKIFGSLTIDPTNLKNTLKWKPAKGPLERLSSES